ncbi:MAG: aldo/keto reductase [Candidatus Bathyarchaeia archaeon]
MLEKREMGNMGFRGSIICLGGCGIGKVGQDEADKAIAKALDYGVNVVDVAPTYGEAETRLSSWVQKHRDELFIQEKTRERSRDGVLGELHGSLKRLGIEKFDLYQMHALGPSDLDTVFNEGGAIEAFEEARETGLTDYIGITGHEDMRVLLEALRRYDFDSVLLPVSLCSAVSFHPQNDYRPVLEEAEDCGVSVTAIKAISQGRWDEGEDRIYRTWYRPSDTYNEVERGVRFTLSQTAVCTYPLPCDHRLWDTVLRAGDKFTPMIEEEQEEAKDYATRKGFSPLFPE